MYVGFGIVLYVAVMLLRFYRCQDFFFPNPKLEKVKKNFYTRFKQAIRLRFTEVSSR